MKRTVEKVLTITALNKVIRRRAILNDINLSLQAGEIMGLIGPNGAGKSTLLKIVSGTAMATSGRVAYNRNVGVGILPESPALLPAMNARQNLELLASIRGVIGKQEIFEALEAVGLDPYNKKAVSNYSLGMKQRLMIAQAIMEKPKLLLLDEPTNGLDPLGIIDLRQLLFRLADEGVGIIIASHLLNEIERMCHRVAVISNGSIWREVNLRTDEEQSIEISVRTAADWERLAHWASERQLQLTAISGAHSFPSGMLPGGQRVSEIVELLTTAGIAIEGIRRVPISLEAFFLECSQLEDGVYR